MTNFATGLTSDLSRNPIILYMLTGQQNKTTQFSSVEEYLDVVWPTELFPKIEIDRKNYGSLPYIDRLFILEEQQEENEWLNLIGIDFYFLSEEKRQFLIQTAGIIRPKQKIDIKKLYETSIY